MANIYDYIDWRGDLPFTESPFNDIDNLILAELCYAEMEDIVPAEGSMDMVEANRLYIEHGYKSELINDPAETLAKAAASRRFSPVRLCDYVNRIDKARQVQFSAITYLLPDESVYVAFRGTDNTIVGWREDFNFSFMETAGQEDAVAYLNNAATRHSGTIHVGGHSKGGNLAVFAAAFCDQAAKDRIDVVYSNDGPGFNDRVCSDPSYTGMLDRVRLIVPSFSIVGILLNNKSERTVVKSDASGPMQHSPLTWQVKGTAFEVVDSQDPASIFMDEAMNKWISSLDEKERADLISSIFDSLDASGADTLQDLKKVFFAFARALHKLDFSRKKELSVIMRKLASAGIDVARERISGK